MSELQKKELKIYTLTLGILSLSFIQINYVCFNSVLLMFKICNTVLLQFQACKSNRVFNATNTYRVMYFTFIFFLPTLTYSTLPRPLFSRSISNVSVFLGKVIVRLDFLQTKERGGRERGGVCNHLVAMIEKEKRKEQYVRTLRRHLYTTITVPIGILESISLCDNNIQQVFFW